MRIVPDYRIPGPIMRINPEELHIDDPDYYDDLYGSASRKRDKYGPWVALVGALGSSFATVGHNHHRVRRAALNPCFSKAQVTKLEPLIQRKVDKLATRFEKAMRTREINITDAAYTALTTDVICQYAFAADDNFLDEDDFELA
jgi:cytochrome P450